MLQRKLLDQLKITDNKAYENLPRGRSRRDPIADAKDASRSARSNRNIQGQNSHSQIRSTRSTMKKVYTQKSRVSRRNVRFSVEPPNPDTLKVAPRRAKRAEISAKEERGANEEAEAKGTPNGTPNGIPNAKGKPEPQSLMVTFKYNARRQKVRALLEKTTETTSNSRESKTESPKKTSQRESKTESPRKAVDARKREAPSTLEISRSSARRFKVLRKSEDDPPSERTRVPRQSSEKAKRNLEVISTLPLDPAADPVSTSTDSVSNSPVPVGATISPDSAAALSVESRQREDPLPYHGVLGFPECIINNTDPTALDRQVFESCREEGAAVRAELQRDMLALMNGPTSEADANNPNSQSAPYYYKRSQIEKIQFRDFLINTWYSSPFPEEYSMNKVIYMCEYCLKYMSSPTSYLRHGLKACSLSRSHPPGIEIYRDEAAGIAFWEVDGRKNIEYCQNLCLLAKLFLNSKTLYYDVEPFVFYILTEIDPQDPSIYHFVGYFSKEKLNNSDYNVSCIITLPIYQRKGYGSLMIDFSYLLSRKEFKFGTPEKPLSDLGLVSYRNYWKLTMASTLRKIYQTYLDEGNRSISVSLETLSKLTGMRSADVVFGLEQINGLVKRGPSYAVVIDLPLIDSVIAKWESKAYVTLKPELCLWKPLIFGPSGGINSAPLAPAVAPATGATNIPQNNPSTVSNSISMITEFLKDDIDNPYTYEEEAGKEIELYSTNEASKVVENSDPGVRLCRPDFEMPSRANAVHRDEEDPKIMISDEEVDNSEIDPEFEDYSGTVRRKKFQIVDSDDDIEEMEDIEESEMSETDESSDE